MVARLVVTEKRHPQDLPDEFYFSTDPRWGGGAAIGDVVVLQQKRIRSILGHGVIVSEGEPYAECKAVRITERYC
jgi:hypothetical protein